MTLKLTDMHQVVAILLACVGSIWVVLLLPWMALAINAEPFVMLVFFGVTLPGFLIYLGWIRLACGSQHFKPTTVQAIWTGTCVVNMFYLTLINFWDAPLSSFTLWSQWWLGVGAVSLGMIFIPLKSHSNGPVNQRTG